MATQRYLADLSGRRFTNSRRLEETPNGIVDSADFGADPHGEMVRQVNALTVRANRPMDDVDHVARTLREWTDRAGPIVGEVRAAVALPVLSWLRVLDRYGTGAITLLRGLFRAERRSD